LQRIQSAWIVGGSHRRVGDPLRRSLVWRIVAITYSNKRRVMCDILANEKKKDHEQIFKLLGGNAPRPFSICLVFLLYYLPPPTFQCNDPPTFQFLAPPLVRPLHNVVGFFRIAWLLSTNLSDNKCFSSIYNYTRLFVLSSTVVFYCHEKFLEET